MAATEFEFGGVKIDRECRRLFVRAELEPANGDPRIQPTGFPDVGPVLYPDPSGECGQICLIESEPSMANRLEEVCLADMHTWKLCDELKGLPYVVVYEKDGKTFRTASTIDSHRFASEYLMLDAKGQIEEDRKEEELVEYVKRRLGSPDGRNVPAANVPIIYQLAMELDPMSLVHGFQISLKNRFTFVGCRSPRALTACIVGLGSEPVRVPGVRIDPIGTGEAGQAIFRKERTVNRTIEAKFSIDVGLLWNLPVAGVSTDDGDQEKRSKRPDLRQKRADLLVALSLWKIARLLREFDRCHRLRTECDLRLKADNKPKFKLGANGSEHDFRFESITRSELKDLIEKAEFLKDRSPLKLVYRG